MKALNNVIVNSNEDSGTSEGERVWPGRCLRASQPRPSHYTATAIKPINIACWNMRTLINTESSDRAERMTVLVAKEL